MTGTSLFFDRLKRECRYQWKVFRMIADWTIIAYLIVPVLIVFGYHYYKWWTQTPTWFEHVSLQLLLAILYLICWQGNLRTFLQDADQLVLIQKKSLMIELKRWTRNTYILGYSLGIVVILFILAPFLIIEYELSWIKIVSMFFFFASLKAIILLLKQYVLDIFSRWKNGILTIVLFLGIGMGSVSFVTWSLQAWIYLLPIMAGILILLFVKYSAERIKNLSSFHRDVLHDTQEKVKYIRYIFLFSEGVEKEQKPSRREPLIYRKSRRVFKERNRENGIRELFCKVFLRNRGYILQYLQLSGLTVSAILIVPPLWIKVSVFLGFTILIRLWVKILYKRVLSNHYMVMIKKEDEIRFTTERMIVNQFSIPVICVVGIVLLMQMIF